MLLQSQELFFTVQYHQGSRSSAHPIHITSFQTKILSQILSQRAKSGQHLISSVILPRYQQNPISTAGSFLSHVPF